MRTRRLIGPCLAVLVAVAADSFARAQPSGKTDRSANPSHVAIPFHPPTSGQFADFLKSRDHARELREAYEQLKEIIKSQNLDKYFPEGREKIKDLLDADGNPPALDDPRAKELIQRWLERARGLQAQADRGEPPLPFEPRFGAIEKLLKETPPDGGFKPPRDATPRPWDNPPQPMPSNPPPENPGSADRQIPPPQPPELSLEEKSDTLQNSLADWWKDTFANSEAIRNLGRKLSQPLAGSDGGIAGEGPFEKFQRLGNYIPFKDIFARGLPKPQLPSMPRPAASAPRPSGPEPDENGALATILWIGLAALCVFVAWKLLAKRRGGAGADAPPAWRLGPWPVDPALVGTREELIRAFEYLSLLLLGPAARHWNHRAIAKRLSDRSDDLAVDRRRAAEHLAALYERARYAPPADPLPEGDVRDAQRDLCLLAGVAHA